MTEPTGQEVLRRLEELERRLFQFQAELTSLRHQLSPAAQATVTEMGTPPIAGPTPTAPQPSPPTSQPPTLTVPPAATPPKVPISGGTSSLEVQLGRQVFDKIALLALLFGVGFFLKYAFERGWISDSVKIISGTVLGYVLLIWSELLFQKSMRRYGSVIAASAFGVLFLTVYAGLYLYQFFTPLLAFAYLLVATSALVLQAVRHESEILAVWSLVGVGFAPQILAGLQSDFPLRSYAPAGRLTQDYQPFSLQAPYLVAVNLAYGWIVFRKHWPVVRLALLMVNIVTVVNWNSDLANFRPMATLLWILAAMFVAPAFRSEAAGSDGSSADLSLASSPATDVSRAPIHLIDLNVFTTGLAVTFFYLRLSYISNRLITTDDYWITLGFAALTAAGAFIHHRFLNRIHFVLLLSFTVLLVYVFCGQAWDGWKLVLAWTELTSLMNWMVAKRIERTISKFVLTAAWMIFISALIYAISASTAHSEAGLFHALLWNEKAVMLALVIGGGIFWTVYFKSARETEAASNETGEATKTSLRFSFAYLAVTTLLGWYWISYMVGQYFRYETDPYFSSLTSARVRLSMSVAWSLYAAALFSISVLRKNAMLRKLSVVVLLVTILKVFLYDVSNLETVYRFVSFLVLSVVLYGVSYVYNRYGKDFGF